MALRGQGGHPVPLLFTTQINPLLQYIYIYISILLPGVTATGARPMSRNAPCACAAAHNSHHSQPHPLATGHTLHTAVAPTPLSRRCFHDLPQQHHIRPSADCAATDKTPHRGAAHPGLLLCACLTAAARAAPRSCHWHARVLQHPRRWVRWSVARVPNLHGTHLARSLVAPSKLQLQARCSPSGMIWWAVLVPGLLAMTGPTAR